MPNTENPQTLNPKILKTLNPDNTGNSNNSTNSNSGSNSNNNNSNKNNTTNNLDRAGLPGAPVENHILTWSVAGEGLRTVAVWAQGDAKAEKLVAGFRVQGLGFKV